MGTDALQREKVAILGYDRDTLWEAPFEDDHWTRRDGCEIWGLNELYLLAEHMERWDERRQRFGQSDIRFRYDRWFEIHTASKSTQEHINWLADCGVSVYMNKLHPAIRQSVRFPIEDAVRHFGVRYFTNTFSYELALAIMEGFKEIHLYGVTMAAWDNEGPPEIADQRASIEFFLGWAMARGIKVVIPEASDLLKTAVMYGFEEHADSLRQRAARTRRRYIDRAKLYQGYADHYRGRAAGIEELERTWLSMGDPIIETAKD